MLQESKTGLVLVGLSGGVDSAVAALLLRQAGYRIEGLFMKNWEEDDTPEHCAAEQDLQDARAVAEILGIRLRSVNFAAEYWDRVFAHFLQGYRAGRTPNPDILCNREIKFRAFLDHAMSLGASHIATGHYARLERGNGKVRLLRSVDEDKDQTYFLYALGQRPLRRSLFPLGGLRKSEVRALAQRSGFPNHAKKDSTGICFIGEQEIGRHHGLMYYTLGQRKGLGIGGRSGSDEAPWFVVGKDLERNVLVAAQGHDHPLLFHPGLDAADLHWISGRGPATLPFPCRARIRHRQPLQKCAIIGGGDRTCRVLFEHPQRAITPGQSVVFYREYECLGGAVIESDWDPTPLEAPPA